MIAMLWLHSVCGLPFYFQTSFCSPTFFSEPIVSPYATLRIDLHLWLYYRDNYGESALIDANCEGMAYLRIEWAALCFSSQGMWSYLWMVIREQWDYLLKWMDKSNLWTAELFFKGCVTSNVNSGQMSLTESFHSEVFGWNMSQYFLLCAVIIWNSFWKTYYH